MKILTINEIKKVNGGTCSAVMRQAMLQEMKKFHSNDGLIENIINSVCQRHRN